MSIRRYCLQQGCSTIVDSGRCAVHAKAKEIQRGQPHQRWGGLYSARWDRASRRFRNEFPLCGQRPGGKPPVMSRCHDMGRLTPSGQTDHVVPHKGNYALFWDRDNNWQALCHECGAAKTRAGL